MLQSGADAVQTSVGLQVLVQCLHDRVHAAIYVQRAGAELELLLLAHQRLQTVELLVVLLQWPLGYGVVRPSEDVLRVKLALLLVDFDDPLNQTYVLSQDFGLFPVFGLCDFGQC